MPKFKVGYLENFDDVKNELKTVIARYFENLTDKMPIDYKALLKKIGDAKTSTDAIHSAIKSSKKSLPLQKAIVSYLWENIRFDEKESEIKNLFWQRKMLTLDLASDGDHQIHKNIILKCLDMEVPLLPVLSFSGDSINFGN